VGFLKFSRLTNYHTGEQKTAAVLVGAAVLLFFADGPGWVFRMSCPLCSDEFGRNRDHTGLAATGRQRAFALGCMEDSPAAAFQAEGLIRIPLTPSLTKLTH